jgi:hypothetical protein
MESRIIMLTCTKTHCAENVDAIQRIRDLHHMKEVKDCNGLIHEMCAECDVDDWFDRYEPYPCLTLRTLDGLE